ncbi:hypothetical protein EJ06DRAFT_427061 [Trichodelitschia bisporula]|uniref:Uncharacterized protein n=1 Tax=Trichodelitschia bisporula TaxID=703511 RepID=A0A6G1HWB6_9PEZI|nr:hypothetical protein EJ06DRAFT_427061 [Trichodelitschia bisporula]
MCIYKLYIFTACGHHIFDTRPLMQCDAKKRQLAIDTENIPTENAANPPSPGPASSVYTSSTVSLTPHTYSSIGYITALVTPGTTPSTTAGTPVVGPGTKALPDAPTRFSLPPSRFWNSTPAQLPSDTAKPLPPAPILSPTTARAKRSLATDSNTHKALTGNNTCVPRGHPLRTFRLEHLCRNCEMGRQARLEELEEEVVIEVRVPERKWRVNYERRQKEGWKAWGSQEVRIEDLVAQREEEAMRGSVGRMVLRRRSGSAGGSAAGPAGGSAE